MYSMGTILIIALLMSQKLLFTFAFTFLLSSSALAAEPIGAKRAYRLQIDNDFLARGGSSDQDYTGGISLSSDQAPEANHIWSLKLPRNALDRLLFSSHDKQARSSSTSQIGAVFFTPKNIESTDIDTSDRPYASLVFVANGQMSVETHRSVFSSLSVGVLGTSFAGQVQKSIHDITGSSQPLGYRHQISAGAEPTAKYSLAFQHVLASNRNGDLKATYQAHAGYLTEASGAVSFRWGRIQTPWWAFNPELNDPIANASPVISSNATKNDLYLFGGAKLKARLYSAMLQGQFRDSSWSLSAHDLEPLILHAWLGGTSKMFNAKVSYTLNYQSPEVRLGKAHRDHVWGSLQTSFEF